MAKEYIERDAALKAIQEEGTNQAEQYANRHHPVVLAYGDCLGKVKSLPAADVVEVVRCKDCIHLYKEKMLCACEHNRIFNTSKPTFSNCFCSYGKRKENSDDKMAF